MQLAQRALDVRVLAGLRVAQRLLHLDLLACFGLDTGLVEASNYVQPTLRRRCAYLIHFYSN